MKRSAGVLLPIFSLPSDYGIGTFGKEAYKFVDFLKRAKQSYWQILPLGQTSYGDSPYQAFSSFAGNPYFIDLDILVGEGLLKKSDLKNLNNSQYIDYGDIYNTRYPLLHKAYLNGVKKCATEFNAFVKKEKWLGEYALFMALKKHFNNVCWTEWPDEDARLRKEEAIKKYKKLLKDDIEFYEFIQYLFYKQYEALKNYANESGIKIIGDIPIYVPLDSVEVWSEPLNFQLDDQCIPKRVAGVPPDYFNADGQLWGNPLYDYDYQKENGYSWWINRIKGSGKYYDIIRIDHFRGFESYWSIPYGDATARNGVWVKGPDTDLLDVIKKKCKGIDFIAEDLGYHSKEVQDMLDSFAYPGMKVLIFAFDSKEPSDHQPHTYIENCICYVGTHDNQTAIGYMDEYYGKDPYLNAVDYLKITEKEGFNWGLIRGGMASKANVFICSLQDYLGLGSEARINTPGTFGNNWKWRMEKGALKPALADKIAKMTIKYQR